jgi:hypothetical protein
VLRDELLQLRDELAQQRKVHELQQVLVLSQRMRVLEWQRWLRLREVLRLTLMMFS